MGFRSIHLKIISVSQIESVALDKRNAEAALEAQKEKVVALEAEIARLGAEKLREQPVVTETSVATTHQQEANSNSPPADNSGMSLEIETLQKKVSEMVRSTR